MCINIILFLFVRVKGLVSVKNIENPDDTRVHLFSVSSDGVLKAWSFIEGKVCVLKGVSIATAQSMT